VNTERHHNELHPIELVGFAALGLVAAVAVPIWAAVELAGRLASGAWPDLDASATLSALAHWPGHAADPRMAFDPTLRAALPGPVGIYGCLAMVLAVLVGVVLLGLRLQRAAKAGSAGFASTADIGAHLSVRALRARAAQTRPSLAAWKARPRQLGLRLGRDVRTGQAIWGSSEDSYLYLGPPRSGKGVHLIIGQVLDAPGAVLTTATRPDTVRHTIALRGDTGPVAVFDPDQLAPGLPPLGWAPQRGCADPQTALSRSKVLATSAAMHSETTVSGDFWQSMTEAVLRCYLHAAALSGASMRDVLGWVARPGDPAPLRLLQADPRAAPGWAGELAHQVGGPGEQRASVWNGVRRALDSLANPAVLDACCPADAQAFDPYSFLRERGTLYLLGSTRSQASVAPLITALLDDLLDAAHRLAARGPTSRLDPPLTLLLDEVANIAHIPTLPHLLADGGGSGITTVAVLQSLGQARARWGSHSAEAMWDSATTKVVLGGLSEPDDLSRISRVAGEIDQPVTTRSHGAGGASVSMTVRRVPVLPAERLRTMRNGRAVVLARSAPPVEVNLRAWWRRSDAARIRASQKAARPKPSDEEKISA
jgi:type IV secretory pathway TraG/TraD family ATPase VirD4